MSLILDLNNMFLEVLNPSQIYPITSKAHFVKGLANYTKYDPNNYHYVREKVLCKDLCVSFVSSKDNLADVFTKPLTAPLFLLQRCKLLVEFSLNHLRGDVEAKKKSQQSQQSGLRKKMMPADVV